MQAGEQIHVESARPPLVLSERGGSTRAGARVTQEHAHLAEAIVHVGAQLHDAIAVAHVDALRHDGGVAFGRRLRDHDGCLGQPRLIAVDQADVHAERRTFEGRRPPEARGCAGDDGRAAGGEGVGEHEREGDGCGEQPEHADRATSERALLARSLDAVIHPTIT
eukprot:scaffold115737_cov66-Phaeocystis_antarctica.AAC.3